MLIENSVLSEYGHLNQNKHAISKMEEEVGKIEKRNVSQNIGCVLLDCIQTDGFETR